MYKDRQTETNRETDKVDGWARQWYRDKMDGWTKTHTCTRTRRLDRRWQKLTEAGRRRQSHTYTGTGALSGNIAELTWTSTGTLQDANVVNGNVSSVCPSSHSFKQHLWTTRRKIVINTDLLWTINKWWNDKFVFQTTYSKTKIVTKAKFHSKISIGGEWALQILIIIHIIQTTITVNYISYL